MTSTSVATKGAEEAAGSAPSFFRTSGSMLPDNKKFAVSTNWGTFRGENAMSLTGLVRVSQNVVLNGGFGAGFQQGGVAGRAGVTVAW